MSDVALCLRFRRVSGRTLGVPAFLVDRGDAHGPQVMARHIQHACSSLGPVGPSLMVLWSSGARRRFL